MRRFVYLLPLVGVILMAARCSTDDTKKDDSTPTPTPNPTSRYELEVINSFPHDTTAFTQGLIFTNDHIYESTGRRGQSALRKIDLTTGEVLKSFPLEDQYFGEGLARIGDQYYYLTWRAQQGFIFRETDSGFEQTGTFSYSGEGWGLAYDGDSQLIMSNGSSTLTRLNPSGLESQGTVQVTREGRAVSQLNELEFVGDQLYANVWQSNEILMIDPANGVVNGTIEVDISSLLSPGEISVLTSNDVLNGIAYDAAGDRLFVTGKNWPHIFEVKVRPKD